MVAVGHLVTQATLLLLQEAAKQPQDQPLASVFLAVEDTVSDTREPYLDISEGVPHCHPRNPTPDLLFLLYLDREVLLLF